ncbi:MAG: threonine synthase, partial [Verrucomicrobia bacterium]|nr:threonine synthase [Verrucomicrobiota bacterium]
MTPFRYRCSTCGRLHAREEVRYLCPECARGYAPGMPLLGVLTAEFDHAAIRR